MFGKSSFILNFCMLIQSAGFANGKPRNVSFNSVLADKIPQSVDQTFNINNWGLGKVERKLLIEIKTKIDSLLEKTQEVSCNKSSCPQGWVFHGKSCYLIISIPTLKWSDARGTCQNLGGDLAIIRSADENKFIFDLVKKQKTVTDMGVWLGFVRKTDNKFYWIDDTPLASKYSRWGSGEPNNHQGNGQGNENCGNMFGTGGRQGFWNDIWCHGLLESQLKLAPSVLCQKKSK